MSLHQKYKLPKSLVYGARQQYADSLYVDKTYVKVFNLFPEDSDYASRTVSLIGGLNSYSAPSTISLHTVG